MKPETSEMLQRRVSELGSLPVMPSILQSLGTCLSASASVPDVLRIVELISYDKSLAAQRLRIANSAMFSGRARVQSVRQAVLALGMQRIRDIVDSCSLPQIFAGGARHGMEQSIFWRHALGTALVSQHLAELLMVSDIEKLHLAGLLHDIGILVNSLLHPEEFQRVLQQAEASETPLCEVEQEILGFTHCESGRVLADLWKLPADIADTIEFHHHPSGDDPDGEITCVVYLADVLCRLRGLGYGYYEAREFDLAAEIPWQALRKIIQRRRQVWTWRDLRLNWTRMGWRCRRWWIRYFPGLWFHAKTAREFTRCRVHEANDPSFSAALCDSNLRAAG